MSKMEANFYCRHVAMTFTLLMFTEVESWLDKSEENVLPYLETEREKGLTKCTHLLISLLGLGTVASNALSKRPRR